MAVDHYENFPVASLLLPRRLRGAVADIYRYARSADDIADEGVADVAERLARLNDYRRALDALRRRPPVPRHDAGSRGYAAPAEVFEPLARTVARHALPWRPFYLLLDAFEQDLSVARYDDYDGLLDYCSRSANPVGELMLHLYGAVSARNLEQSAQVCTGLQLVNFWQDVAIDASRGRIYLPRDDMRRFGVDEGDVFEGRITPAWRALMAFETRRAGALLHCGASLAWRLPGRIGWELRLVVLGGLRILERIRDVDYDVFHARPTLRGTDWLRMLGRSRRPPGPQPSTHS